MPSVRGKKMSNILDKLQGGDLRSIGKANEVVQEIKKNPALFNEVFCGLSDNDPVIRMRSADVVEKVTKDRPELLLGYSSKVISILASVDQQEVCWHLAQISPRLEYTKQEKRRVTESLKKLLSHKSKIVRVSAMEALTSFAERDESILKEVTELIMAQMKNGSPAVLARGRNLLRRLEGKKVNETLKNQWS